MSILEKRAVEIVSVTEHVAQTNIKYKNQSTIEMASRTMLYVLTLW